MKASAVTIVHHGLHFLRVIRIPFMDTEGADGCGRSGGRRAGAYVLGLAFAFGWTPCIGPQLGMILSPSRQQPRSRRCLLANALGLGMALLATARWG